VDREEGEVTSWARKLRKKGELTIINKSSFKDRKKHQRRTRVGVRGGKLGRKQQDSPGGILTQEKQTDPEEEIAD